MRKTRSLFESEWGKKIFSKNTKLMTGSHVVIYRSIFCTDILSRKNKFHKSKDSFSFLSYVRTASTRLQHFGLNLFELYIYFFLWRWFVIFWNSQNRCKSLYIYIYIYRLSSAIGARGKSENVDRRAGDWKERSGQVFLYPSIPLHSTSHPLINFNLSSPPPRTLLFSLVDSVHVMK